MPWCSICTLLSHFISVLWVFVVLRILLLCSHIQEIKGFKARKKNHISTIHFSELLMCKLSSFEYSHSSPKYQLKLSINTKLLILPALKDNRLKTTSLTFKQGKPPISYWSSFITESFWPDLAEKHKNVKQNPDNSLNCSSSSYFRFYTVLLDSSLSKLLATRALSTDGSLTLFSRDSPAGIAVWFYNIWFKQFSDLARAHNPLL